MLLIPLLLGCAAQVVGMVDTHVIFTTEESEAFKAKVLDECQAPTEIQDLVNKLLAEKEAQNNLINNPKMVLFAGPAFGRLSKNYPEVAANLRAKNQEMRESAPERDRQWNVFCKKYNLKNLTPDANTYALTSDTWDFILRTPRSEWFDRFDDNATPKDLSPSKFQNVSRVVYAKQINDFIASDGLDHIYPLQQWLVHIPGQPHDLSDKNYLVACEKIQQLPLLEINMARFQELIDSGNELDPEGCPSIFVKEEWFDLVTQLVQVITRAAMWNIKLKNVFLIEDEGRLKVLFLDTEKPGLSGGFDEFFYHTHAGEVISNTRTGMEGLANIFVPDPTHQEAIKIANARERELFAQQQEAKKAALAQEQLHPSKTNSIDK